MNNSKDRISKRDIPKFHRIRVGNIISYLNYPEIEYFDADLDKVTTHFYMNNGKVFTLTEDDAIASIQAFQLLGLTIWNKDFLDELHILQCELADSLEELIDD